jgi:hypothetical protein
LASSDDPGNKGQEFGAVNIDGAHPAVIAFVNAHRGTDHARMRRSVVDDFAFVDHRPAGFGSLGVGGYLQMQQSGMDMSPDRRIVTFRQIVSAPKSSADVPVTEVTLLRVAATDGAGFEVEWEYLTVWLIREGVVQRLELFPAESAVEAIERARELAGS